MFPDASRRLGRDAAPHLADDVLDDDDAVVDQKAESDDDCSDRYLFERDAEPRIPMSENMTANGTIMAATSPGPQAEE